MTLSGLAGRVAGAEGLRRAVIAFVTGAVGALAMPPFGLWPVLFLTCSIAVWLVDGAVRQPARLRAAAIAGWWFGFGYFLAGLWWIGSAFLVEADVFGWLMPFAVIGMPAGLAIFFALGFVIAALIWTSGPWRVLGFALALGSAEFLRGIVLTGFPWNAFGYALADNTHLGQATSIFGVEGLTFLSLFVFASPAALANANMARRVIPVMVVSIAVLAGLAAFGILRLRGAEQRLRDAPIVRVVQPVVPQDAKFRPSAGPEILSLYLALSMGDTDIASFDKDENFRPPGPGPETLLIWPESAFPFLIEREPAALEQIGAVLHPGTTLLTGAARIEDGPGRSRVYNSVLEIDSEGRIGAAYDKVHLVPFGEYLPFQNVLESIGLQQLTRLPGGFVAGQKRQGNLMVAGLGLRPLICYEALFPGEVADLITRPDIFLNVTNDAWFGDTPGPYQHIAMAKVRSIELGIPMIRAANSGISALVDAYGRTLQSLPLGERGVIEAKIPPAIHETFYSRWGRISTGILVMVLAISYAGLRRRI